MAEKILIARHNPQSRAQLHSLLRAEGFFVLASGSLEEARTLLRERPAVLLCDSTLVDEAGGEAWAELERCCRMGDSACVMFCDNGLSPRQLRAKAPWVAGTLSYPGNIHEVGSKLADVIAISRLSHELELAHQMLHKKQRDFSDSLRAASQVQKNLLPHHFPRVASLRFAQRFLPCDEVGGDLLNVLRLDEHTVMAYVFDVSGHGVSSAMVSVSIHQSLSPHSGRIVKQRLDHPPHYRIPPPAEVIAALQDEFPFERFEKFFTITYLLLDIRSGELRYCNAGHPPPVVLRADGRIDTLAEGSGLIGLRELSCRTEGQAVLEPGDRLFLYSDGILEYRGTGGLFGYERLVRRIGEGRRRDLESACDRIIEGIFSFGRGAAPTDDITLLAIERH